MAKNYVDIKIGAHYNCFNNKRATYEALKSFRRHYPDAPVFLFSDGGDDFKLIADHFNCHYGHSTERTGNGKSTYLETEEHVMLWLCRLQDTCKKFTDVDWIVILEDDVKTQDRISRVPPAPMAGPCTMEFTAKLKAALRKKHNIAGTECPQIRGYSGCGGTIIHRETFLKCMENMFAIPQWAALDHRVAHHSDAILTLLFLFNGYANDIWLDQSERARSVGRPDAAFDHQNKEFYGKAWDDSYLVTGIPAPKPRGRGLPIRFHLLGLAHLPTRHEYVSCAYTWKILRLAQMLKMRGHEVIFYGVDESTVECDEFVPVVSKETWKKCYGDYDWKAHTNFKYDSEDAAHKSFNDNAIREIKKRTEPQDILLCSMGWTHKPIADATGVMAVESGIGYEGIFARFKIFA